MSRYGLAVCGMIMLLACMDGTPVSSVSLSEFDSTVDAFASFTALLETQSAQESDTDQSLLAVDENPSYTLAYPPVTFAAAAAAGGFVHPYSNVNPLAAPWAGFAPIAGSAHASAAAIAASPLTAYLAGAVHPALGVNTALFPANTIAQSNFKGGYNVHGLTAQNMAGAYHPGLEADLTSLGGKEVAAAAAPAAAGESNSAQAASLLESSLTSGQSHRTAAHPLAASVAHNSADIEAGAGSAAYGLFPAPTIASPSASSYQLGPHKLQFAGVGSNEIDTDFPAFVEMNAEAEAETESETESDAESDSDADADADSAADTDMTTASWSDAESEQELQTALMQLRVDDAAFAAAAAGGDAAAAPPAADAAAAAAAPANPSYTLPYPPILPGHYTPLFNPYTNVNPLSTPFSNYAAQAGSHPGVAAAAAAQAGSLSAINGQIAGQAAGGYIGAGVGAAGVPFSGYAGLTAAGAAWIHPQNLNSASVGTNEGAASLGQFIQIATEQTEHGECSGCEY